VTSSVFKSCVLSPTAPFGLVIRYRRQQKKITQAQLARVVPVSQAQLSRIERGQTFAPLSVFIRILDKLDLDLVVTEK